MLKRSFTLIALAILITLTLAACGSKQAQQPPQDQVQLDKYPIVVKKQTMTDAELQRFGLRRVKIDRPTAAFNHYRNLGRNGAWKYEVLPMGTEVAADRNGRVWYKTDCSNRLFVPSRPTGWWPFGGPGGSWPWWLLWLLLPLLGLLGWLLWPRKRSIHERPRWQRQPRQKPRKPTIDPLKNITDKVERIEADLKDVKTELAKLNEPAKPAETPQPTGTAVPVVPTPTPAPDPSPAVAPTPATSAKTSHRLTLAEAQDLCLRHIKMERAGIRALYKRWDNGKIGDDEFVAGVEAILAD